MSPDSARLEGMKSPRASTPRMKDRLSRAEIRKDAVQDGVTAAAHTVGAVSTIVAAAVGDVARALGGFATEMFEIRDSARRASDDHRVQIEDADAGTAELRVEDEG
jgi:hypothetical protein